MIAANRLGKISRLLAVAFGSYAAFALASAPAWAQSDKPNILVIWGDDIGLTKAEHRPDCQGRHDLHRLLR